MGEPNIIPIIFPVYIFSMVENPSTEKILKISDFGPLGLNGFWYIGYLYIQHRW